MFMKNIKNIVVKDKIAIDKNKKYLYNSVFFCTFAANFSVKSIQ